MSRKYWEQRSAWDMYQFMEDAEETADMLEEPINLMRQIYEMLDQYTPDYDVEKIYKGLLEKAILPV